MHDVPICVPEILQIQYEVASACRANVRTWWLIFIPTDSRLTVGRPLCRTQGLSDLRLGESEGEATDLELFRKLPDLVQVHSVNYRTLSGRTDRICKSNV